jgi:glycosyltransferase involved in cell wall biosynthesis
MKICYIADAVIHTQRWVKYFADRGHEVHLISPVPLQDGDIGRSEFYLLKGFSRRLKIVSTMINLVLGTIQIRYLLKKINPDIFHAHYIADNGLLAMMSGFHPLVLSSWGSDILIDPRRSFFLKTFIRRTLRKADLITTDGENTIEGMKKLGADPKRIHLVYPGVDTGRFKPAQKNEALKKELGISESPAIISIRSLNPIYDVETVVKSVPLVLKQFPEAQFLIGGDGVQKDYLEDMARSLGILGHIKFIGQIPHDELPNYLTLADVYISTSLSDGGLSVSLAEAMSCGLAPVVTDVGDNRRWIENGKNGFVIPVKNPEILAERIVYLLRNKELRENMGKVNRQLVEERANYEKEMDKVEKHYEEVIRRN